MIKAYKEYWETVQKPGFAWLRKYWKEYLIFLAIVYAIYFGAYAIWWYSDEIGEFFKGIKKKFSKQEAEEA